MAANQNQFTPPTLPYEPPVELDSLGRKLWETLVNGKPQFANWADLIWEDLDEPPTDPHVRREMVKLTNFVNARLDPIAGLMEEAVSLALSSEIRNQYPSLKFLKGLTDPVEDLVQSLRSMSRERSRARILTWTEAENIARNKLVANRLAFDVRGFPALLQAQTLKQLGLDLEASRSTIAQDFEEWRLNYVAREQELISDLKLQRYRSIFEDRDRYDMLVYSPIHALKTSTLFYKPLSELIPFGEPVDLRLWEDFEREYPAAALKLSRAKDTSSVESSPQPVDHLDIVLNHPRLGPLAIQIQDGKSLFGLQFYGIVQAYGSIYDPRRLNQLVLYEFWDRYISWRSEIQDLITSREILWRENLEQPIEHTREITASLNISGSNLFPGGAKNILHPLAYSIDPFSRLRNLLRYQILTRGITFWHDRAVEAENAGLPQISSQSVDSREWKATYARKKTGLRVANPFLGNHAVLDPDEKKQIFTVTFKSRKTERPPRYNLAPAESLSRAAVFSPPQEKPQIRILGGPFSYDESIGGVLPIPSPLDFVPTIMSSYIEIRTKTGLKKIRGAKLNFFYDQSTSAFGLDTSFLGSTDQIEKLSLSFVETSLRENTDFRLTFKKKEIEAVKSWALSVGASALVHQIDRAKPRTAATLATAVRNASVYSLRETRFNHRTADWRDFVNAQGKFEVQCTMATALLMKVIRLAMTDPLATHLTQFRASTQFGYKDLGENMGELTSPFHEVLNIYFSGRFSEALDATPAIDFQSQHHDYEISVREQIESLAKNILLTRTEITSWLNDKIGSRSTESSIPTLPFLILFGEIYRLADLLLNNPSSPTTLNQLHEYRRNLTHLEQQLTKVSQYTAEDERHPGKLRLTLSTQRLLAPKVMAALKNMTRQTHDLLNLGEQFVVRTTLARCRLALEI